MTVVKRILLMTALLSFLIQANTFASSDTIPDPPAAGSKSKDSSFDRKAYGVVDILYNTGKDKKVKLIIEHNDQRYIYNLQNEDRYVTFPLQLGDGSYSVQIYENTSGTKYKKVYSDSGRISLDDQNIVYLNSIQQVEWAGNDAAVLFAGQLLEDYKLTRYGITDAYGNKTLPTGLSIPDSEIIDLYYTWVVENLTYDYDKIDTLEHDYVPDIDLILEARGGICYDYSVLLAAMLRSQGIHSRLIKGYTTWTSVYHAWNEIYMEETGEWVVVDTTYDSYLHLRNRPYEFEKSREIYTTSYYY